MKNTRIAIDRIALRLPGGPPGAARALGGTVGERLMAEMSQRPAFRTANGALRIESVHLRVPSPPTVDEIGRKIAAVLEARTRR